jgi:hypothetical protein
MSYLFLIQSGSSSSSSIGGATCVIGMCIGVDFLAAERTISLFTLSSFRVGTTGDSCHYTALGDLCTGVSLTFAHTLLEE